MIQVCYSVGCCSKLTDTEYSVQSSTLTQNDSKPDPNPNVNSQTSRFAKQWHFGIARTIREHLLLKLSGVLVHKSEGGNTSILLYLA